MNVKEGLVEIRSRLVENGASPKTLQVVDVVMQRASLPAAQDASAGSLLQLTRMLMRSPAANADPLVYDDFVQVEAALEHRADEFRIKRAEEDARPIPKTKKFYKDRKDKDD
jgi:hypothetical protein